MARVTIINQFYTPDLSPTAHLAASLAEHRAALSDEVTVIASRGGYMPASVDQQKMAHENPRVQRIWTPQLGKANMVRRCVDYLVFYVMATLRTVFLPGQDVIIAMTTPPYITWAAYLHRMLHRRTRIIIWNMDSFPEGAEYTGRIRPGSLPSRIMGWMNRFLFKRIERMICLDTAMAELCRRYETAQSPLEIDIIPNWEPLAMFPHQADPGRWKMADQLGLDGRFVVIYLGNTGFGHQFDAVMDAAELLKDEPVTFLFVGGGQRWAWLAEQKQERRLEHVILHGYVPKEQTPQVMAAADCALITLRDAALGINSPSKVHANLAMGLPIVYVGPQKSNVDDAIERFDCGVSLRNGDAAGIARFIRSLMADHGLKGLYRNKARAAFEEAYCDRQTLRQFDSLFDELLQTHRRARRTGECQAPEHSHQQEVRS